MTRLAHAVISEAYLANKVSTGASTPADLQKKEDLQAIARQHHIQGWQKVKSKPELKALLLRHAPVVTIYPTETQTTLDRSSKHPLTPAHVTAGLRSVSSSTKGKKRKSLGDSTNSPPDLTSTLPRISSQHGSARSRPIRLLSPDFPPSPSRRTHPQPLFKPGTVIDLVSDDSDDSDVEIVEAMGSNRLHASIDVDASHASDWFESFPLDDIDSHSTTSNVDSAVTTTTVSSEVSDNQRPLPMPVTTRTTVSIAQDVRLDNGDAPDNDKPDNDELSWSDEDFPTRQPMFLTRARKAAATRACREKKLALEGTPAARRSGRKPKSPSAMSHSTAGIAVTLLPSDEAGNDGPELDVTRPRWKYC